MRRYGFTHERLKELISAGGAMETAEPGAIELLAEARSARDRRRIKGALAARRLVSVENAAEDAAAA